MSGANPEHPVSAAFAQGADTIKSFVADVGEASTGEQARLTFAPAAAGSPENSFKSLYGGLIVGRFLFAYYTKDNPHLAQPSFHVDLVDSPWGLPDLTAGITFDGVNIGRDVLLRVAGNPQFGALREVLIHNITPSAFGVMQVSPNVMLGKGAFGGDAEKNPIAKTAAVLINLGVAAIKHASPGTVNRSIRKNLDNPST